LTIIGAAPRISPYWRRRARTVSTLTPRALNAADGVKTHSVVAATAPSAATGGCSPAVPPPATSDRSACRILVLSGGGWRRRWAAIVCSRLPVPSISVSTPSVVSDASPSRIARR
jgi:hypothetical protein